MPYELVRVKMLLAISLSNRYYDNGYLSVMSRKSGGIMNE